MTDVEICDLAAVVGANARMLRLEAGATLEDVAREARHVGLKWTTGKVGDLEAGRIKPTLPTLLALSIALSQPGQHLVVPLADLVAHDGLVKVNDGLVLPGNVIAAALRGEPVRHPESVHAADIVAQGMEDLEKVPESAKKGVKIGTVRRLSHDSGQTEARVARDLGISSLHLLFLSARLWERTFTQERNIRAGEGSNAQKRGRIARELKIELKEALSDGHD